MARTIYKLMLTEVGLRKSPVYDCNDAHVIIASTRVEARQMAEQAHADEPGVLWREKETCKVTAIGVAHGATKSSIVLTSFHAG